MPPTLLRGPHYQLGPTVRTFTFMYQYSVTSDYGAFTATSDARLRRLIREIAAIAEFLAGYHRSVAPIQRLDIYQNVPVAYTGQGSAVILLPIDRLLWTEQTLGDYGQLAQTLPKPQPIRKVEVWLTGDASDRTHQGLQQLGITVVEHVGQRLPLLD